VVGAIVTGLVVGALVEGLSVGALVGALVVCAPTEATIARRRAMATTYLAIVALYVKEEYEI
jgi:hypothetical protein